MRGDIQWEAVPGDGAGSGFPEGRAEKNLLLPVRSRDPPCSGPWGYRHRGRGGGNPPRRRVPVRSSSKPPPPDRYPPPSRVPVIENRCTEQQTPAIRPGPHTLATGFPGSSPTNPGSARRSCTCLNAGGFRDVYRSRSCRSAPFRQAVSTCHLPRAARISSERSFLLQATPAVGGPRADRRRP